MQHQHNRPNQPRGLSSSASSNYVSLDDDLDNQNLETTPPRSPRSPGSPRSTDSDKKPTFWNKVGGAFAKSGVALKQASEKVKVFTLEGAEKIKEGTQIAVIQVRGKIEEIKRRDQANTNVETGEATDPRRVKSTPPPITRSTPVAVSPGLVFGVPLAAVLQDKNGQPWPSCVPPIVEDTVNYLEARALQEEGVFRISAALSDLQALKAKYNAEVKVDLSNVLDPHLVASLLKMFCRELPDTIFTNQLMTPLTQAAASSNDKAQATTAISKVTVFLPRANRLILGRIFVLLRKVADNSSVNKMTEGNLNIIFSQVFQISPDLFDVLISDPHRAFRM